MEIKGLNIKKMEIEDLDEVFQIESSSSICPWSKNMFLNEMRNPSSFCYIIQIIGIPIYRVMGFICFRNIGEESELLNIGVHPRFRRMGIGKKLMQFYINFCKEAKVKRFYLEVNASNQPAIRFYQSFAFQSSGVREKFYQGKFDAILMEKRA